MVSYVWPILLIVLSNTVYQICSKGVPADMNPFASLVITYLIGAAAAFLFFLILGRGGSITAEFRKTNWAPLVLGLVIVGLEVGFIYAYRAGWQVSVTQIVCASLLAVILIVVGRVLYKEGITWNKVVGVIVCLAGLGLINMK